MTSDGERAARAALERLLGDIAAARAATVAPLGGGINRSSWRVDVGASQWVLQLPRPGAEGLLDVTAEAEVIRAVAAAGLAPRVAGIDAESGALLTEYRAGARAWRPADARDPRNIARVAALLRSLHGVEAHAPPYTAERFARRYLAALSAAVDARRAHFDSRSHGWADELLALAREYDAASSPVVLCHNDLVAANVLDGGVLDDGDLVLVDFEYAVRSAPALDLAGLAGLNDYGTNECRALLDAYHGESRAAPSLAELVKTVRMVRLVAYFWARVGALRVAESAPYSALAAELERKLK